MIERIGWSQTRYRHLRASAPMLPSVRMGTPGFAQAVKALTLHFKLPMWKDYSHANLQREIRPVIELAPELADRPALIIGFGPSFHGALDVLTALPRDHGVIIAADRALPRLWSRGILPDFVVSLDAGDAIPAYYDGTPRPYLDCLVRNLWIVAHGDIYTRLRSPEEWAAAGFRSRPLEYVDFDPLLSTQECSDVFHAVPSESIPYSQIAPRTDLASSPVPRERLNAILGLNVNPLLGEWFAGRSYWYLPHLSAEYSAEFEFAAGLSAVPTAGNTGTLCLNLATILGARPIFLLGLDFSPRLVGASGTLAIGEQPALDSVAPMDVVVDANLIAYAVATRRLLIDTLVSPLYQEAQITNFSGGILHGPFVSRDDVARLPQRFGESAPRPPRRVPNCEVERSRDRMMRFTRSLDDRQRSR